MTDVKERVARAIAKVLYLDGVPGDDTVTGTPYLLSDAALSALGWEEMVEDNKAMREALEDCIAQIEYLHGKFQKTGTGVTSIARARGEKT